MPTSDKTFKRFTKVLSKSKNIIAVAGAGLSAASGIPTFRGSTGGLWRKYDGMKLATPEGFADNPSLVWQFYHYRRETALKAQPNAAHTALVEFSKTAVRHAIAPESTFTLITQNVDGLSARVLQEAINSAPGEFSTDPELPPMLEMHGRLFDVICTSSACGHSEFNTDSPICESLAGTEKLVGEGVMDPDIPIPSLPRCSRCGSLARPGVVWFGEVPKYMDLIDELVSKADLCLVVGTSSTVYPAAGYAGEVQDNGGKVAVFNLELGENDDEADFTFVGPCEELLPKALGLSI